MRSPLKWHGGKYYLAPQIVKMMPPHTHYVEPFAGGLSVLLHKDPEGVSEVVNDASGQLVNFWRVLRGEVTFRVFQRKVQACPFSEEEWNHALGVLSLYPHGCGAERAECVDCAFAFFVLCRQSLAGRMRSFAPLSKSRTRGGMNEQASAWLSTVEGLPAVHERLRRVAVRNVDALDLLPAEDGPGTLFYLDPPYMHGTRATTDDFGAHEMTDARHNDLLDVVLGLKGKVMLSGYPSPLYGRRLKSWEVRELPVPNNAAGGASKRVMTECVWTNFNLKRGG